MTEKLSICLLGPKKGGKSSLLATLTDCVAQSAFGYSPLLKPMVQPIPPAEFASLVPGRRGDLLETPAGDYERLREEFAAGGVATDTLDTYEYCFRLTLNGAAPAEVLERSPFLLQVIDSAGEIAAPPDGARVAILNDVKQKLARQIVEADALILVLPLVRLEDSAWNGAMARLVDRLAQTPERKLRRLVVAFSQYERLFVRLGPSAFTYACDPAVALHCLRRALRGARWLDGLRALEYGPSPASVRFTVTSAYGFVKRMQNPNLDPNQPGDRRFRRAGLEGTRAYGEFWRPFLTAEPFLYAALGLDSAFTFPFARLDARAEELA